MTTCVYARVVGTLNVRLSAEDERRVRALHEAGVVVSELVRDAIRAEHERRIRRPSKKKPSELLDEIFAAVPEASDPGPLVDATDRRAVQAHIRARLRGVKR